MATDSAHLGPSRAGFAAGSVPWTLIIVSRHLLRIHWQSLLSMSSSLQAHISILSTQTCHCHELLSSSSAQTSIKHSKMNNKTPAAVHIRLTADLHACALHQRHTCMMSSAKLAASDKVNVRLTGCLSAQRAMLHGFPALLRTVEAGFELCLLFKRLQPPLQPCKAAPEALPHWSAIPDSKP